jgi:hypothetical protein
VRSGETKGKESFVMCFANMLTLSQDVRYLHLSHEKAETNPKGGNNAGHTIVVGDKKYDFHILPSGTILLSLFSLIAEFG